jgi:hypothetical protein
MAAGFGIGMMELLILLIGLAPANMSPLPADAKLLAAAPEECLFYASWYGMAEPRADSRSHTERLLAEPEVASFVSGVWRAIQFTARQQPNRDATLIARFGLPLMETMAARPSMVYLEKVGITPFAPEIHAGLVVNLGDHQARIVPLLKELEQMMLAGLGAAADESEIDGVKVRLLPIAPGAMQVAWGMFNDYLFIVIGSEAPQKLIGKLKNPRGPPTWLEQIHKQLPVERPGFVQYLNLRGILAAMSESMPEDAYRVIDTLGLTRMDALLNVSGIDASGYLSQTHLRLNAGPGGVFSLLPTQPLTAADLANVPADSTLAVAFRLNLAETYTKLWDVVRSVNPTAEDEAAGEIAHVEEKLGFRLLEDLYQNLGDSWTVHNSPSEGGLLVTGLTAQVSVRDHQKLATTHAKILELFRSELGADSIQSLEFAGQTIHYLFNPTKFRNPIAPAWCLTKDALIVSANPQTLKAHLAYKAKRLRPNSDEAQNWKSLESVPEVASALQEQPIKLFYVNTGEILRLGYPILQAAAPTISAEFFRETQILVDPASLPSAAALYPHALPSVTWVTHRPDGLRLATRESIPGSTLLGLSPVAIGIAMVAESGYVSASGSAVAEIVRDHPEAANSLKQLALGMHNYHDGQRRFPANASRDKNGKPLLSWRVHLLPYLEQQDLYNQFKLDEPWDSEHNKKLIEKMPAVFGTARDAEGKLTGKTRIVVPVGADTIFPDDERGLGTSFASITDGTSNTILLIEIPASKAVVWTKPDDWTFDPEAPAKGLFEGVRSGEISAAMADGSVRTISANTDANTLKGLFTRSGGEVIDLDQRRIPRAVPQPLIDPFR